MYIGRANHNNLHDQSTVSFAVLAIAVLCVLLEFRLQPRPIVDFVAFNL